MAASARALFSLTLMALMPAAPAAAAAIAFLESPPKCLLAVFCRRSLTSTPEIAFTVAGTCE